MVNNNEDDGAENKQDLDSKTLIAYATLIRALHKVTVVFDTIQKPLLGLGTSIDKIPTSIHDAAMELPVGFEDSMATVVESFQAGMFAVDKSSLNLAARMKVTGEDSRQLFTSIRKFSAVMGDYTGGTAQLSDDLLNTSETYHTQTTVLINALDRLGGTFEKISPLADARTLEKLTTGLTGEVGSANASQITRFLQEFLDPTAKSQAQASMLGLSDLRNNVLTDTTGKDFTKEILASFPDAIERMNAIAKQSTLHQGSSAKIYGEMGLSLRNINNAVTGMDASQREALAITTDFNTSWSTFKDTALKPILAAVTWGFTKVIQLFNAIGPAFSAALTTVLSLAIGKYLIPLLAKGFLAVLVPTLAPFFTAILPITLGVIAISFGIKWLIDFFGKSEDAAEKRANEVILSAQADKLQSSRLADAVQKELGVVFSYLQLNGGLTAELLTENIEAVQDSTRAIGELGDVVPVGRNVR